MVDDRSRPVREGRAQFPARSARPRQQDAGLEVQLSRFVGPVVVAVQIQREPRSLPEGGSEHAVAAGFEVVERRKVRRAQHVDRVRALQCRPRRFDRAQERGADERHLVGASRRRDEDVVVGDRAHRDRRRERQFRLGSRVARQRRSAGEQHADDRDSHARLTSSDAAGRPRHTRRRRRRPRSPAAG